MTTYTYQMKKIKKNKIVRYKLLLPNFTLMLEHLPKYFFKQVGRTFNVNK